MVQVMEDRMGLSQPEGWASEQFGKADLGDIRRTRRLVKLGGQMAVNSSGSIPQQTATAADMKAAYRLFAMEEVTHEAVCRPHFEQTRAAAGAVPMVFLIQDGAQLNFNNHIHCEGLGPIGHGELKGLCQQNVLAADPTTRLPLGLMYQKHPRRAVRGKRHHRAAKRKVPLEKRESYWWIEAIRAIGSPPPGVRWVHVGDRGEDIFGVYDACREQGTDWLIRVARDRKVLVAGQPAHLIDYARSLAAVATRSVEVRDHNGKGTRQVSLSISAGPLTLVPVQFEPQYAGRAPVSCWVVRAWETDPPKGQEPLEWLLLTSLSCDTSQMALFAAEGYSLRWLIEEFHKCEKTGCQVEARRLENVDRLEPLIGMLSILAAELLRLKYVARTNPHEPARKCLDAQMVGVMASYLKLSKKELTVGEFWRGIGRLGGHVGRKCDGPVGWLRAWRGWQSFQLILIGARLSAESIKQRCG